MSLADGIRKFVAWFLPYMEQRKGDNPSAPVSVPFIVLLCAFFFCLLFFLGYYVAGHCGKEMATTFLLISLSFLFFPFWFISRLLRSPIFKSQPDPSEESHFVERDLAKRRAAFEQHNADDLRVWKGAVL